MSYLREAKKQETLRNKLLMSSVAKDETRHHLMGICHVESVKGLCATNGHTLTILRSRYNESLDDTIINPKTFEVIERDYPKINTIIPVKFEKVITYSIEAIHYAPMKKGGKGGHTHFYTDGTLNMGDIIEDRERLFTVNAAYLKHLVGGTFKVGFNAELSPVVFNLSNDNVSWQDADIFLIMPLKV